jgi:hypothetical protein
MLASAQYFPKLMSSVFYGGLNNLSEYVQMKNSFPLVGDIKLCNITVNCKNLIGIYNFTNNIIQTENLANNNLIPKTDNLIEFNKFDKNKIYSQLYTHWNADVNLGGGCLNRFGSVVISLVLYFFDNKKISKINGCARTFIQTIDGSSECNNKIRQLTADDFCTFQLNLEPNSILVNVTINCLSECRYNQEIIITGTTGCLILNNSKLTYRTRADLFNKHIDDKNFNFVGQKQTDPPPLPPLPKKPTLHTPTSSSAPQMPVVIRLNTSSIEKEIDLNLDKHEHFVNSFLKSYANIEDNYPELPLVVIRGLYYYLLSIKEKFTQYETLMENNLSLNDDLDSFEHLRIVQSIISSIYLSSSTNKSISVSY